MIPIEIVNCSDKKSTLECGTRWNPLHSQPSPSLAPTPLSLCGCCIIPSLVYSPIEWTSKSHDICRNVFTSRLWNDHILPVKVRCWPPLSLSSLLQTRNAEAFRRSHRCLGKPICNLQTNTRTMSKLISPKYR